MSSTPYKHVTLTCSHTIVPDVCIKRGREKFYHCTRCGEWRKVKATRSATRREKVTAPEF